MDAVLLTALREFRPKAATLLASLPAFVDRRFAEMLKQAFPLCENISVDYAVLERAPNVAGFAIDDFGWNGVGSWNAVYELLPHDERGNVVRGEALLESSSGNYVDAQGKLVALVGVQDLVIVDTPDALLIADRSRSQEVGDLVKALEKQRRDEVLLGFPGCAPALNGGRGGGGGHPRGVKLARAA